MLPSVEIAGITVSTYWGTFAIGLIGMLVLCILRAKRYTLPKWKGAVFAVLLAICGLIGTKTLYILENWEETLEHGVTLGGQSFFGAVFLIPLLIMLVGLALRMKPSDAIAFCAIPVVLMITAMRFGCFLNGCCGGIKVNDFRIPVQLIESFGDLCILMFLLEYEQNKCKDMRLYAYFMVGYGILRFCVEFVRDTDKDWLYLSHGQVFAIAALLIGGSWIILMQKKRLLS